MVGKLKQKEASLNPANSEPGVKPRDVNNQRHKNLNRPQKNKEKWRGKRRRRGRGGGGKAGKQVLRSSKLR